MFNLCRLVSLVCVLHVNYIYIYSQARRAQNQPAPLIVTLIARPNKVNIKTPRPNQCCKLCVSDYSRTYIYPPPPKIHTLECQTIASPELLHLLHLHSAHTLLQKVISQAEAQSSLIIFD